ncbi:hypothetical protein F2Q69_00016541 [Brassica cretica]|uniref:Secreted protein n=1 Tax=Brassica cretica TaxID=69181 RepID=A0A8S9QZ18_BRACR|nr:hypothetical protein F2Q69_00016541 [Brassica cretica]
MTPCSSITLVLLFTVPFVYDKYEDRDQEAVCSVGRKGVEQDERSHWFHQQSRWCYVRGHC